jgi:hypothetical protein
MDGLAALGGMGAGKFGRDELEALAMAGAGEAAGLAGLNSEAISETATDASEAISSVPLYPNEKEFSLPKPDLEKQRERQRRGY